MIYLKLFLNFLMIGALSFGGGYGMVSLVRETVVSNGWLIKADKSIPGRDDISVPINAAITIIKWT